MAKKEIVKHQHKEITKATIRCIPNEESPTTGKCVYSGNPSNQRVLFAKAY